MHTHLYMVLVSPKEGREKDWLDWHANQHSLDMLDVDGIISCKRFEIANAQMRADPPWQYMAIYEIETDDLSRVFAEVKARFGTSLMPTTDASEPGRTVSVAWIPLSEQSSDALKNGAARLTPPENSSRAS